MGLFGRKKKDPQKDSTQPATGSRLDLVVPLMAGRAWLEGNEQTFRSIPDFPESATPFAQQITDELWVTYATDPQGAWEIVQQGQIDELGGAEALFRTAVPNLIRRVAADLVVEGGEGRYRLQTPSEPDLACSLLLAPDFWRGQLDVAGDPVICAPTRLELLVCGSEDADSVAALRQFATSLYEEARGKPVTRTLHVLGPSGLVPLA